MPPKRRTVVLDFGNEEEELEDELPQSASLDAQDDDKVDDIKPSKKFVFKRISKETARKIKEVDQTVDVKVEIKPEDQEHEFSQMGLGYTPSRLKREDNPADSNSASLLSQLADLERSEKIRKELEELEDDTNPTYNYSESGSDYTDSDDDLQADRDWYTQDEAVGHTFNDEQYNDEETEIDHEFKKKQQTKKKKNFQSEWFDGKLKQANALKRDSDEFDEFDEVQNYNEVDENGRQILVHRLTPPFIDSDTVMANKIEIFNPVKDPTGDMYTYSKNGSTLVNERRQNKERNKTAKEVSEVKGTVIGEIIGDEKPKGEEEKGDINQSKFIDVLQDNEREKEKKEEAVPVLSIKDQRKQLPAFQVRRQILKTVNENQVVIVIGETGSGKTTQICQFLYEEGYHNRGLIGVTQPRRVAAMSVAKRVGEEMSVKLGNEVGFTIRFEDFTNDSTKIKFMTDGILLRESLVDSDLNKYSCIIIDEAHERSLNTDILLGFMKQLLSRRRDLKIIITSATMNAEKFSRFFGNAPNFTIPGRTFPVDVMFSKVPSMDYVDSAIKQIMRVHIQNKEKKGDILVFMTGQEDIETTCELLAKELGELQENDDTIEPLEILPIYSTLPEDLQSKIFNKSSRRKCVVATNIAETSLTIDGILFVIDCGLCKLKVYNPQLGMDSLQIVPISLAQANQRSGRAGRTAPGVAYRLYTQTASVEEMFPQPIPEIQRTNLINILLVLKKLGVKDLTKFPFLDPPSINSINTACYDLWSLGALDNFGELSELGNKMSSFPIEPVLSKLLILSTLKQFSCSQEILTIISMLSIPSVFHRPNDPSQQKESDKSREKFYIVESDHLTLLNVYNNFIKNRMSERWCNKNFLNYKSLRRCKEIKDQLVQIMASQKIPLVSSGLNWDLIRKCICASFYGNGAQLKKYGEYVSLRTGLQMRLHPTSSLFGMGDLPKFAIYHEVILLGKDKQYMNYVTSCDLDWLCEFGQVFYSLKSKGMTSIENQKLKEFEFDKLIEREKLEREVDQRKLQKNGKANEVDGTRSKFDINKKRRRVL